MYPGLAVSARVFGLRLRWHPRLAFALASAACVCAGIRGLRLRWHPRFVSLLQASPLCGAAPTFLCRRKEK
ncbi:hypothetical protein SAMN04487926_120150 [Paraburkholderia steynii]|uniref:Uncharacterized protein n=1 Tax=Paraburkholderia steynii TaxID=1245441 RepID=A0A7Z7BED9_9BURK|nr:hypothetical protein SAMN04487926_120150 [Paraburkholderia steynii]